MNALIYVFVATIAVAAVLATLAIWAPRTAKVRFAALLAALLFIPLGYLQLVELLARPKPIDFEWFRKDAPAVTKLEDLKGKTIAVNRGSIYDTWGRENAGKYGFQVESFNTTSDAVQAVMAGRAFANLAGNTAVAWAAKKNPDLKLSYTVSTGNVFAIPFRKDDVAMRNQVEGVIECMKRDGFFAKLSEKWFGVAPQTGAAAVTVFPGYGTPGFEGYDPTQHTPKCS